MSKIKVGINADDRYEYTIKIEEYAEDLGWYDAVAEVDREFIDRYNKAYDEWQKIQTELSKLAGDK